MHPHAPAHGQPYVRLTHRRVFARAQVLSGPSTRLFWRAPRTPPTRRPTPRPSPWHSASWRIVQGALLAWGCRLQAVALRSLVRMQLRHPQVLLSAADHVQLHRLWLRRLQLRRLQLRRLQLRRLQLRRLQLRRLQLRQLQTTQLQLQTTELQLQTTPGTLPGTLPGQLQLVTHRSFCLQLTMLGVACRCEGSGSRPGRSTWAASRLRWAQGPRLRECAWRWWRWLQRCAGTGAEGPDTYQDPRRGSAPCGVRHAAEQKVRAAKQARQAVGGGNGPRQAAKPPMLGPGAAAIPATGQAAEAESSWTGSCSEAASEVASWSCRRRWRWRFCGSSCSCTSEEEAESNVVCSSRTVVCSSRTCRGSTCRCIEDADGEGSH